MLISDIVARIPDDDLAEIRKQEEWLTENDPTDDNGNRINWFEILVLDWYEQDQKPPVGWFQWWDD